MTDDSHPLSPDLQHILEHTPGLWEGMREGRLFITGGTGFFGKWLLESFAWANARHGLNASALVLTRSEAAFRSAAPGIARQPGIEFWPGDVRSFDLPPGRFTHVIHAATPADAKLNEQEPETMFDLIVQGTRRALDLARRDGAKVLMTSSGAVYGRQPPECRWLPEEYLGGPDVLNPASAYAEGKRVAEHFCAIYHHRFGIDVKIARCFAFVGPYLPLDAHFAIGNFIRDGLAGGPIQVNGDGTPYRSYLHAADLMIWLWTILMRGPACRAYNVGSPHDVTIADLARAVAAKFKTEAIIARSPDPGKPAERYVPDVERARRELGLEVWIDLDQAIDRTVQWHRK